eukprot:1827046-Heterocapsa_arctica.AAC.1
MQIAALQNVPPVHSQQAEEEHFLPPLHRAFLRELTGVLLFRRVTNKQTYTYMFTALPTPPAPKGAEESGKVAASPKLSAKAGLDASYYYYYYYYYY